MRTFTIHKPTHKFVNERGDVCAIGQLRGSTLYLNRFENFKLVEKSWAVESGARHLTNYGKGYAAPHPNLDSAWKFTFGVDIPTPVRVEKVDPRLKTENGADD